MLDEGTPSHNISLTLHNLDHISFRLKHCIYPFNLLICDHLSLPIQTLILNKCLPMHCNAPHLCHVSA